LIKKIIIIILIFTLKIYAVQNEIDISKCSVSGTSSSDFVLSYQIKNSFDDGSYSSLKIVLPFEKYIVQGNIENGKINERDLLYSQINMDLNKNGSVNDSYPIRIVNKTLIINNQKINPITKTTSKYNVLIPFDSTKNFNVNRISSSGIPFTLRNVSVSPAEITIGFNENDEIEFRKCENSLLLIEVITPEKMDDKNLQIDGQNPFTGITNEVTVTGGENSYRYAAVKKIILNKNSASGEIKIGKISRPFSVRVSYFFSLSESLILMNQKILRVN